MFEKRIRLVERDERQLPDVAVTLEKRVHFVLVNASRQPHVAVDRRQAEERQVSPRQTLEERRQLGFGDVVGRPATTTERPAGSFCSSSSA